VPALNLPQKTAALVAASRNKLFEKKIQLLKWDSELKKMNLESVPPHQQRAFYENRIYGIPEHYQNVL
jgi:hypothetical protein